MYTNTEFKNLFFVHDMLFVHITKLTEKKDTKKDVYHFKDCRSG
jgi:hypothetical protein